MQYQAWNEDFEKGSALESLHYYGHNSRGRGELCGFLYDSFAAD
jgi:hypothetical protein